MRWIVWYVLRVDLSLLGATWVSYQRALCLQLSQMTKNIQRCTRLKEIPIPLSYTRLCSWVVLLWSLMLVLVVPGLGWGIPYSASTVFALTFLLLGIEDVGVQIEEPFHYLPIEQMLLEHASQLREEYRTNISVVEAHTVGVLLSFLPKACNLTTCCYVLALGTSGGARRPRQQAITKQRVWRGHGEYWSRPYRGFG